MQVGEIVEKKYELVRLVGESGIGLLYQGRRLSDDLSVAIKLVFPQVAFDDEAVEKFLHKARAVSQISSPYIAAVLDTGVTEEGCPFVVRPFLEGGDLAQVLAQEGPLAPGRAVRLIRQACSGLETAHAAGHCHWDLKTQNLFLARLPDGTERLFLLDFGSAELRASLDAANADATVSGASVGMPYYLPLEAVKAAPNRDHRADVYSLGAMLYELLCGAPPYEAENFTRLLLLIATRNPVPLKKQLPGVTDELAAAVDQAMAREVHARFGTVGAFSQALSAFESDPSPPLVKKNVPAPARLDNLASTRMEIPVPRAGTPGRGNKRKRSAQQRRGRTRQRQTLLVVLLLLSSLVLVLALLALTATRHPSSTPQGEPELAPASVRG